MDGGRILLVAGGTGGHIMPAISFGSWAAKNRRAEVIYACGARPLEKEIYSNAGISPKVINLSGSPLSGGIPAKTRIERIAGTVGAVGEAGKILKELKPDRCVVFGGYVSLPFMLMCRTISIPVAVHEQNACAGLVTRLAAKAGVPVFSGWETCFPLDRKKFKRVGVPVRKFDRPSRADAMKLLGIPEEEAAGRFTVVVFSGSLGSSSVKEKILEISENESFKDYLFLIPSVADATKKMSDRVWVLPKIWDPSPLFAVADCAVTRGGGSMLTELAVLGIPALIIPWREAAGDHQYYNAVAFISENAGIILNLENESASLAARILELRDIASGCVRSRVSGYNQADKICEKLWDALACQF